MMKTEKPVCVCCGKSYGQRDTKMESVRWPEGEPMPPYKGNGIVVKETSWSRIASKSELQARAPMKEFTRNRMTGETVPMQSMASKHLEQEIAEAPDKPMMVAHRTVWSGEYWKSYEPFCTLRCALAFARASYKGGYRIKQKATA